MYFPVLRGKRFELLALRESADLFGRSRLFFPVIEPVRARTLSTDLRRAAEALAGAGVDLGVVVNPTVGELAGSGGAESIVAEIATWPPEVLARLDVVIAMEEGGNQDGAARALSAQSAVNPLPRWMLCTADFDVERVGVLPTSAVVAGVIAPRARTARRLAAGIQPPPAILEIEDPFPLMQRNRDYLGRGERIFTDQHLYYADEGLAGFADYATIGAPFRDGGGSPNYVTIHWTYTKPEPRADGFPIFLQHFSSSDAELDLDVGAKFHAAVGSLLDAMDALEAPETAATATLRDHYEKETFPGLGVLKKLSLTNHFSVVETATR